MLVREGEMEGESYTLWLVYTHPTVILIASREEGITRELHLFTLLYSSRGRYFGDPTLLRFGRCQTGTGSEARNV